MQASCKPTPVVVISGLCGAGKTALINHVIKSFDGKLCLKQAELVLPSGGIDIQALDEDAECLLIENTATVETLLLLKDKSMQDNTRKPAKLVTVLDCFYFIIDYAGMDETAQPSILQHEALNKKKILDAVIEQADIIVLNKTDLVATTQLTMIKSIIQLNNEYALIMPCSFGKIPAPAIINTGAPIYKVAQHA